MAQVIKYKDVLNVLYHGTVISGLIIGVSMIGKKMLKVEVGDPSKASMMEALKLSVIVSTSIYLKGLLEGIGLPPDVPVKY